MTLLRSSRPSHAGESRTPETLGQRPHDEGSRAGIEATQARKLRADSPHRVGSSADAPRACEVRHAGEVRHTGEVRRAAGEVRREIVRAGRARGRARLRLAALLGFAAVLILSGCTAPRPEVTFYGDRTAVTTDPTRWCTVDTTAQQVNCTEADQSQVERLTLRAGQPVQINVPGQVGDQPWGVYFRYRDAAGQLQDGRSEIFTDGRLAYTLRPFDDADQLVYVEVQSGFVLTAGTDSSNVDFAASQSWLLLIDPAQPTSTDD